MTQKQISRGGTQDRLGTKNIGRLLAEFSIPATIAMLVNAIYNMVDRMFIGNAEGLESIGLTALTVSFPIMMIMMGLALMFGAGGAALFSIRLGEKDREGAEKVLGNAIMMIFITAFVFMVLALWNLDSLLWLFGAREESMPYAKEYMSIILYAAVLQGPAMGCNHFMRADGSPKTAMVSMFIGAGFNIIFDYIFIFIFHMGMTGAALATVGGQGLSAIWGISYFLSRRSNMKLRLKNMRLKAELVVKIILAGLPSFVNQISASVLSLVLNNSLRIYGGDVAIGGIGAITSLQQLLVLPTIGISHGAQPIIGYNRGAGKYRRIKETLAKAILSATVVALLGFTATRLWPEALIGFFGKEEKFREFGTKAIGVWMLMLPTIGTQIIGALYFQAVGRPKISLVLTLSRQILVLLPMILILSRVFGLMGILAAAPISDAISFLLTGSFLLVELKRLTRMEREKQFH
ncbi:MATE family efflux transporter [Mobilitalea sibirica]|uniref:Multidrug export protein MepA n=1 Tax=Mobilitalea sibirica TaxID=1462919 RepID=A0A8J7HAS7_9FIRM|nr:MATE family efflux transporter [Mobilitalea sibirica]MBH1941615.1 MATE family efflux transporter [Mobilitalea sibirica]